MRHPISAFPPSFTGAPLRNRVDAAATERIAAQYSPHSKSQPAYRSPLLHSLYRVLRAGRREPAAGLFERRYEFPIQGYQPYKHIFHDRILPRAIWGLRYEGFLTGLRPDPPKTFLKEGFWISKNFCQKGLWQRFGVAILVYRFYRKRPQHFVPQPCRLFFRKNQSRPQTKSPSFPNAATRSRFTSSEVAPTACPRAEITIRFPVLRLRSDRMPR